MRPSQYHYIKRMVTRNMYKRSTRGKRKSSRKKKKNNSECIHFFIFIGILYAATAVVATIMVMWKVILFVIVALLLLRFTIRKLIQTIRENRCRAIEEADERERKKMEEIELNAMIRNYELKKQDDKDNYEQWKTLTK